MSIVERKYKDTKEYQVVLMDLITAAHYEGCLSYPDVAAIMGLPGQGNHMGKETGWLLGEISEAEHLAGRPMLSAIVVGSDETPGDGFFKLAKDLGRLKDLSPEGKRKFWEVEKAAVYETWRKLEK